MDKILTGSRLFFDGMKDFMPKDTDYIVMVDRKDVDFLFRRKVYDAENNEDIYYHVRQPKEKYIRWALVHELNNGLGQFLTPAFCKEMGITVEDLELLRPMRDRLDKRHQYQAIIYDAYIENGEMDLTIKQRNLAYNEYKNERKRLCFITEEIS